jgi:undecaprenyl-diphosphatase
MKNLWKDAWKILCGRVSAWWLLLALPMLIIAPLDEIIQNSWRFEENGAQHRVAQYISKHGDFYNSSLILVAVLLIIGWVLKKKNLQILALAMIFSCATAGILSLGVRVTSGRPRPSTQVEDGLYGPRLAKNKKGFLFLDYDYQSFPSGHATTAVATAVPALIVAPVIGVPLAIGATAVMWARLQLNRHRLSDLYMGIVFGGVFGAAFGLVARRRMLCGKANQRKNEENT